MNKIFASVRAALEHLSLKPWTVLVVFVVAVVAVETIRRL
jgi:hypothetical protein